MKRLLSILLFSLSFPLFASAQNYLTNGQVYNFNVGDEFETENCSNNCMYSPPTYVLTKILAKWYTVTPDSTIYYQERVQIYTPPSCFSCVGSYSSAIDTVLVTNLDSAAIQDAYLSNCSCSALKDTVYIDSMQYCGRKVWIRSADTACTNKCFEPIGQTSEVIEGCGGIYINGGDLTVPDSWFTNLVYYKKGTDSCGTQYIITGINEPKAIAIQVIVYPNPSNGIFTIAFSHPELVSGYQTIIKIYNAMGQEIYSTTLKQVQGDNLISLTTQPNGVYFYRIVDENSNLIGEGKLIIQK